MKPETIRAFTPICLGAIGGLIGVCVIFKPNLDAGNFTAGLGLAGTAIAGASGLAQPIKDSSDSVQVNEGSPGSVKNED